MHQLCTVVHNNKWQKCGNEKLGLMVPIGYFLRHNWAHWEKVRIYFFVILFLLVTLRFYISKQFSFQLLKNNKWFVNLSYLERWPPEPKAVGSSPSWRTRLNSIEIAERLSLFESFFFICILKFTHGYPNFNATLTKLKSASQSILCSLIWEFSNKPLTSYQFLTIFNNWGLMMDYEFV